MQTEQLDFVPVVTPHTLDGILKRLGNGDRPELVRAAEDLKLILSLVVHFHFATISAITSPRRFWMWFHRNSQAFLPYRVFLNFKLFALIGLGDLLGTYQELLEQLSASCFPRLVRWKVRPERMSRVLREYLELFRGLIMSQREEIPIPAESAAALQGIFSLWVQDATRLDFGLTAIFLVLEEAIPGPSVFLMQLLATASERELNRLSDTSGVIREVLRGNLRILESLPRRVRSRLPRPRDQQVSFERNLENRGAQLAFEEATARQADRQVELAWLETRKELPKEFGGQWIVVEKDQLVAHSPDYEAARAAAEARGLVRPFIFFIPSVEREAFMGI